jgi:hypothetical protein
MRSVSKALDDISDLEERKRINKKAATAVQNAARALAPRSRKPHFVYSTPKTVSGQRAKRGSAKQFRTKYLPGNLALSIRVLNLRRAINAVIGPRILNNPRAKVYGRNERNVNAFYAQMVYGSAKAFRDRVMAPALAAQSQRVQKIIEREVEALKRKAARKNGLD